MVTVMCQFQLLLVTAASVGGNCRFQWVVTVASYQQTKFYYKMYILKNFSNNLHDREVDNYASWILF